MNRATLAADAWSAEQDRDLIRLAVEGKTSAEIALLIGRSKSGVERRRHRLRKKGALGVLKSRRVWTEQQVAEFCAGVLSGRTESELAAQFGATKKAVSAKKSALRASGVLPPARDTAAGDSAEDAQADSLEVKRMAMPPASREREAEIASRIAALGITGGLLGDPLPGRSALDQRRSPQ